MPEAAEVEAIRLHLERELKGGTIQSLTLGPAYGRARMWRGEEPTEEELRLWEGAAVLSLGRHGKVMWLEAESPRGQTLICVSHLGMSGWWRIVAPGSDQVPHEHLTISYQRDGGGHGEARLCDPRRFGRLRIGGGELAREETQHLGVDVLTGDLNSEDLTAGAQGRGRPLKTHLLDQAVIAGLGNIYADETCHYAGVSPLRPAGKVSPAEWGRLAAGARWSVREGLRRGGATLSDGGYRRPDGEEGNAVSGLKVHAREGEPCYSCETKIRRVVVSGRSTYYCPNCQK